MKHTKRWLAALLAVTMTLSDCGGMTVLATENPAALLDDSVSDNHVGISDEFIPEGETGESDDNEVIALNPSEDTENTENDSETDAAELPALHIGQIKEGEDLPAADDDEFLYDLPISFETSEQMVLFANYNLNTVLDEEDGTLVWSILRGEKGLERGTANLLAEEDDWTDFETVSASPFFVMEEISDEESDYYQMISLTLAEPSSAALDDERSDIVEASEKYDYYIRAAYYPETESGEAEAFYAAATIPFVPQNTDAEEVQDDTEALEDTQSDSVSDNTISADDTTQEEMPDMEAADAASDDMDGDNTDSLEDDSDPAQSPESVSENSAAAEPLSTLTGNEGDAASQPTKEGFGVLTVSAESVTLHVGDTLQISATLKPENPDAEITWTSSDANIVSVPPNTIDPENKWKSSCIAGMKALAAGTAQITAKCGDDLTATVKVNVIAADEHEVYDLSGDIWIDGFQKENADLFYTGQKITQNFRVYYKETLLTEKTDYTLSYKNNVNAAAWNSTKAPNVTIKMKGQYQGSATLYYTIYPADIRGLDIYNPQKDGADENDGEEETFSGYKQTVNYSKNLKLPTPELTFGKKKLAVNKDFECDYTLLKEELQQKDYKKGDSYTPGKIYHYTVKGIGNFTESFTMQLVVLKDKKLNFSSAAVTLSQKQYEYRGALSKADVTITKLTINKQELGKDLYDYKVYASGIDGAYIMVYPTPAGENAGYCGFKKVALKLVGDRKISDAALGNGWKQEITFSQKTVNEAGGIFQDETGELLTFGEGAAKETLIEGRDYTVKYTNAKKVGTVTATFTGKGRYKGTLKQRYTILPNNKKQNFTIRWKNVTREGGALVIAYQKGGVAPDFVLLDQDNNVLKSKTDYTVKLKDNKAPGNMSCEIIGKGNYKGYTETVQITVKNADISQCILSVPDKAYSEKANAWKSKVTVKDANGKTLAAGKDYEKDVTYSYPGMENEQFPKAGTTVTVTVKGMGFYANNDAAKSSLTDTYRIFQNNISKLQVVIDSQEYTGKAITLSDKDIHVYATAADKKAKKELADAASCYQIVEYKNNIKAGTAKVTLRGIGDYGGTKIYSFKILKKTYLTNHVKSITLDKTNLNISLAEKGKRTLTATIAPKDASQQLTNPTVIWTTSNSNIATVEQKEPAPDDKTDTGTNTDNSISVTAAITVQNAGTVKITAIAQDGNKKAVCTVKITVPALKEKGQTLRGKTGDTYQLSFAENSDYEIDIEAFTFESTNTTVASVDSKGLITMNRFGMAGIKVYVGNHLAVQQCSLIVERVSDDELTEDNKVLTYVQEAGCEDDTAAINALLQRAEDHPDKYDTVYIPEGSYHIDAVKGFGGIILRDNQNLVMSPKATLTALSNASKGYHIIWAFGRSNVTISGGTIVGERNSHKGSSGESGHGIEISGCSNVYISNVQVSHCWGDGIYLGFYEDNDRNIHANSTNVIIENCNLHHNRRSNMSITDASNVTVRNCQFNSAGGTDPGYGIDIEPNAGKTCSNVTISNSTFKGNAKGTILILGQLNAHVKGVKITNCTGDKAPLIWQGFGGSVSGVTQSGNSW